MKVTIWSQIVAVVAHLLVGVGCRTPGERASKEQEPPAGAQPEDRSRGPAKAGESPRKAEISLGSAGKSTTRPAPATYQSEPTRRVEPSPELSKRGATLYTQQCAACHGADGRGSGPAAYLLYPKPRDFTLGTYRFTSTWDGSPTDDDLYRVISRGVPGSAMPSWAHLSEQDRWALAHQVKTFAETPIQVAAAKDPDLERGTDGEGVVRVPPEPKDDRASRVKGAQLFATTCAQCHGERGQGDGKNAADMKDSLGFPIRPRDLTTGVFKGSPRPDYLYRRIVAGIPMTPMPASPQLHGEDAWHLVHYVLSLSSPALRELAEMRRFQVVAARSAALPDHPDAGAWGAIQPVNLHLMPLWWRYNRPEYLTIKATHDGKDLALLLVWNDETNDEMAVRPQDFRDAAAIEFSRHPDAPFFAMGEAGKFVDIWMWKSERQADLAFFHDIDDQYPNNGIDSYPNISKTPYEQPMRHALTADSNPTFVTAWGAGNIVADPTLRTPAESLYAQGFGSLKAHPRAQQNVAATGVHSTGSYRVMFRASLRSGGEAGRAPLAPGSTVPVSFAIWNGSAGDRDGKKSVTIWQDLYIAP